MATTSDNHSAPDDRDFVDHSTAGSSNIRFATIAPRQPPTHWAATYHTLSRVVSVPASRSTRVTTGLKWAPDTAPNMRISPINAPAVAAAFSNSCNPTSSGDRRVAMIPEPITAMIRNPVPSASATRRRVRSRWSAPLPVSTSSASGRWVCSVMAPPACAVARRCGSAVRRRRRRTPWPCRLGRDRGPTSAASRRAGRAPRAPDRRR